MTNITELDNRFVAHTYNRFPIEIVSGKGSLLYDRSGKEYIDMGSGIGVSIFGSADDVWIDAVSRQLETVQHTSNLYYTEPCARLAALLNEKTNSMARKVFFANSGAEANECAIKAARKYAAKEKGAEYFTILTLENSFHGRTLSTLAATGQTHYHELYQPLTPGFVHAPANDFELLKKTALDNKVCAVLIECIQGEGGVVPLKREFVQNLRVFTEENGILLIIDEVQTGNGRSGKLYSYMNYDIIPDIVTTAKGLSGGLPLGACMLGEKTENVFDFGDHGSTFGGNPVCCAGALSVLSRIDEALLSQVREKSEYVFRTLSDAPGIENVSGMGLMIGIKTKKPVSQVLRACQEQGVLPLTAKDKLRLLPPLNIPFDLLKKAVSVIKTACSY